MKKLITLLLILLLTFPMYAAAAPSPTVQARVYDESFKFEELVDETLLAQHFDAAEGYILEDAYIVYLEKKCGLTKWQLPYGHTENDDVKVIIAWDDAYEVQQAVIKEDTIFVDFTDFEVGTYLVYFFIKPSDA